MRLEAHRYIGKLTQEFEKRGIYEEYVWWIWKAYENAIRFNHELKHNPETYNMPAKDRVDEMLIIAALGVQMNRYPGKSINETLNRDKLRTELIDHIKNCGLEEAYMSEVNKYPSEMKLIRLS